MEEKSLIPIQEGYNLPKNYLSLPFEKAKKVNDIIKIVELEQLVGQQEKFYVNTNEVRGANTILILQRIIQESANPYVKLLFSGFTGSGKTTELVKLYSALKKKK